MFFRTAKECWSDILFIASIVVLIEICRWALTLVPFLQPGLIALFIGQAYLMGYKDGQLDE